MSIYKQVVSKQKEIIEARNKNEDTDKMIDHLLVLLMDNFGVADDDEFTKQLIGISLPLPDIDTTVVENIKSLPDAVVPIAVMRFILVSSYKPNMESDGWQRFVALLTRPYKEVV